MELIIDEAIKTKKKLIHHGFIIATYTNIRTKEIDNSASFSVLTEDKNKTTGNPKKPTFFWSAKEPRATVVCNIRMNDTSINMDIYGDDLIPLAKQVGIILEEETGKQVLMTLKGYDKRYEGFLDDYA